MKPLLIAFAVVAMSASTFGASQAQDSGGAPPAGGGGNSAVRQACAADIAKVCPGVDRAGMRQCVTDNFSKLSDACQSAIMAMQSGGGGSPPPPPPPPPGN